MKFIISGKNITVSQGLKTAVEDKLGKLERYFTPDTEVVCNFKCRKRTTENRSNDPDERKYHQIRTGKQ